MNRFFFKRFFIGLLLTMLLPTTTLAQIDYGCWGTINVYLLNTTTVTSQYNIPSGYEWKVKSMVWSAEKYSDSPYGDSYEITSQNGKTCVIKGRSFPSNGKLYCKMKYGDTDYMAYYNVNAISMGNLTIAANPSGGTVNAGTKVYLTCNESGASIFYTTDGTDPIYNSSTFQPTNGSLYNSSGITINQTTTIKAFAAKKGYKSSSNGTWTFTVNQLVTSITLNKTSLSLQTEQNETLTATVKPDNATDKTVTWSSSNTSIATVSNGKVTAISAGSATITCKANDGSGVQATCSVTVTDPVIKVTSITLNKSSLSLQTGQNETLTAAVKPDNATDKTVTWSSSNNSVATVTSSGKVNAVSSGSVTITCKANDGSGVKATCTVTVNNPQVKGDVNGDGYVNGTDLVALTNIILGKSEEKASADVNGDGYVNGTDYVVLVNIILGKSNARTY